MHSHCGMVDIHGPLQTRGETRCPGGVISEPLVIHYKYLSPRTGLSAILHDLNFTYHGPFPTL